MDEPNKETLLNQKPDNKVCLNCGFPNRATDSHCMYCQTSLADEAGLIDWFRQTYFVLRWRWQLKQKREKVSRPDRMSFFKAIGYFFLGAVLSGVGVILFTEAVSNNSFSKGLIAILFLFYGVFTLKGLFVKK
ncbi:MAG: hypothetical protein NPINA01_09930 [Nitrospinaceae bacterium]|nr:MAG: hypothetical protein NPINA01_09930 [Nitrospinaceae bacterium]